jgi:hypothetical protein
LLVRVTWLWLTGLLGRREQTERAIATVVRWLAQPAQREEWLVRSCLLWQIGQRGTTAQVEQAMEETTAWLKSHPNDDMVRVSYLLFLAKRKGTISQVAAAVAQTQEWLRSRADDELLQLAVDYVERRTPNTGERHPPAPPAKRHQP